MLPQRLATWLAGLAIIIAIAGASRAATNSLAAAPAANGQAIACNSSHPSGGGC